MVQPQPQPLPYRQTGTPVLGALTRHGAALLAAYFVYQVTARLLVSSTLDLDEAEQLVLTRELRLGYGPQPPLYTWLQWLVFQLTGPSMLGLTLLKNVLLAGIYLFTYGAARRLLDDRQLAVVAAVSLLFIPQVAWESQRDLSHSVLVTTCAAGLLFSLAQILATGRRRWFIALGGALAAGLLAKYSFVLYAGALLTAAVWLPASRARLLRPELALALALAALAAGPHYLWALAHMDQVTTSILGKLDTEHARALPLAVALGWGNLLWALFQFLTPLWLILALTLARRPPEASALGPPDPLWIGLLGRYLAVFAAGMTLLMLVTGGTSFKDRWMLPFAFMASLAVLLVARRRVTRRRLEYLARTGAVFALVVALAMPLRVPIAGALDRPLRLNAPLEALATELRRRDWHGGLLLTDENYIAGSLQLHLPGTVVVDVERRVQPAAQRLAGRCGVTLVWEHAEGAAPPTPLRRHFRELTGRPWIEAGAQRWSHAYRYSEAVFAVGIARAAGVCVSPEGGHDG